MELLTNHKWFANIIIEVYLAIIGKNCNTYVTGDNFGSNFFTGIYLTQAGVSEEFDK